MMLTFSLCYLQVSLTLGKTGMFDFPDFPKVSTKASTPALTWFWSFCVPASCTGEEAASLLNFLLTIYLGGTLLITPFGEQYSCQSKETAYLELSTGAIATM